MSHTNNSLLPSAVRSCLAEMRYRSIFDYRVVLMSTPPPFSLPWTLYFFAREAVDKIRRVACGADSTAVTVTGFKSKNMIDPDDGVDASNTDAFPRSECGPSNQARKRYLERRLDGEEEGEFAQIYQRQANIEDNLAQLEERMTTKLGNIEDMIRKLPGANA